MGLAKNRNISGRCVECGSIYQRTYDVNGNTATSADWNGTPTVYTYDLNRNLETKRLEADGTALARTISTAWHLTLRLAMSVAEPKRITRHTYDAAGNMLTRSIQATTDLNGSLGLAAAATGPVRTWTYTYNSRGQIETVTGPRVDLLDRTTYTYDSASGGVATVKNALGHTTVVSNYDANGRPQRVTAPNGVITDLTYGPRGWLDSRTVKSGVLSETTSYDYDGVGQLKKLTMPDGATLNYTYDDAHRLTGISDSRGNSISYTLDYVGNRIDEQVKDPGGALARQVSRQYDALNQLKQQTGAPQ